MTQTDESLIRKREEFAEYTVDLQDKMVIENAAARPTQTVIETVDKPWQNI